MTRLDSWADQWATTTAVATLGAGIAIAAWWQWDTDGLLFVLLLGLVCVALDRMSLLSRVDEAWAAADEAVDRITAVQELVTRLAQDVATHGLRLDGIEIHLDATGPAPTGRHSLEAWTAPVTAPTKLVGTARRRSGEAAGAEQHTNDEEAA